MERGIRIAKVVEERVTEKVTQEEIQETRQKGRQEDRARKEKMESGRTREAKRGKSNSRDNPSHLIAKITTVPRVG